MAKYSSKDLTFKVGDHYMEAHFLDDITIGIEAITEDATAFGDAWEKHIATGINRQEPITVGGYFDDTATTGPHAKFRTVGATFTIVHDPGGDNTSTFDAIVKSYQVVSRQKQMTRFVATLLPTGPVT